MNKQYWIYTAKNGTRYIQTYNKYLANGILHLTDIAFYKINIESRVVYSFQYSENLEKMFETLHQIKNGSIKY